MEPIEQCLGVSTGWYLQVLDSVEQVYSNRKALARTLKDSQTVVAQVQYGKRMRGCLQLPVADGSDDCGECNSL